MMIPQKVIRKRLPWQGECLPFKVRLPQTWSAWTLQMYGLSESDSESDSEVEIISFSKALSVCTCASSDGRVSYRRDCPCNPRNVAFQGTASSGPAYTVTGPLPTVEWKDLAINRLSSLAGVSAVNKIRSPDPLKPVPCREIAPHMWCSAWRSR